jgi:hypothetical protein
LLARYYTCLKALRKSSSFFLLPLRKTALDTLQAAGADGKPMLGSKLSADSGAKASGAELAGVIEETTPKEVAPKMARFPL